MQPIVGLGVPGAPLEPCLSRIGEKIPYAYAWQSLREAGAAIAFSSDWPVSPLDPFLGMQAAMTRRPALPGLSEQRQTLMDTVRAFTLGGAYTEFAEDKKGKLAEGYLADVIVLNGNIETTPAHEIAELKPVATICDGKIVYEA